MLVNVAHEQPVYNFRGCCPDFGQKIVLYANDLRRAEDGHIWSCEDQDQYPNRQHNWTVEVQIVFKSDEGALLITTDREPEWWGEQPEVTATWVQFAGDDA